MRLSVGGTSLALFTGRADSRFREMTALAGARTGRHRALLWSRGRFLLEAITSLQACRMHFQIRPQLWQISARRSPASLDNETYSGGMATSPSMAVSPRNSESSRGRL